MFSSQSGFFYEFVYFKDLVQDFKLDEFILDLLKSLQDKNGPFKTIKSIYTCLSYWQNASISWQANKYESTRAFEIDE